MPSVIVTLVCHLRTGNGNLHNSAKSRAFPPAAYFTAIYKRAYAHGSLPESTPTSI